MSGPAIRIWCSARSMGGYTGGSGTLSIVRLISATMGRSEKGQALDGRGLSHGVLRRRVSLGRVRTCCQGSPTDTGTPGLRQAARVWSKAFLTGTVAPIRSMEGASCSSSHPQPSHPRWLRVTSEHCGGDGAQPGCPAGFSKVHESPGPRRHGDYRGGAGANMPCLRQSSGTTTGFHMDTRQRQWKMFLPSLSHWRRVLFPLRIHIHRSDVWNSGCGANRFG